MDNISNIKEKDTYKYIVPKIQINNEAKAKWLKNRIGDIFKILPLVEMQGVEMTKIHIVSLISILASGNDIYFENNELIDILPKLNIILKEKLEHAEIRKIVLECTNFVNKLIEQYLTTQ
jgi:hypothetical protein